MSDNPQKGQIWKHYRGGIYEIICIAMLESDCNEHVVYRGSTDIIWVRPLKEFLEKFYLLLKVGSMEIRLKEGDGLVCEISGSTENALIKLQTDNGETPWMGIEALKKAYKILAPIAGHASAELVPVSQKPVYRSDSQAAQPQEPQILLSAREARESFSEAPKPQPMGKLSPNDIQNLNIFQKDLVQLMEDPPPMQDGVAADGLSEAHIRRLISDHQGRFRDPFTLFPILKHHLGMPRERFEKILQMNQKSLAV